MVRTGDLRSSDGTDLGDDLRRMVPLVAALLNQCALELPGTGGAGHQSGAGPRQHEAPVGHGMGMSNPGKAKKKHGDDAGSAWRDQRRSYPRLRTTRRHVSKASMPTRSVGDVHAGPEERRDGIDTARGWT